MERPRILRGGAKEVLRELKPRLRLEKYLEAAGEVIRRVRDEGDQALIELTRRFDGVDLRGKGLRVGREAMEEAYARMGRAARPLERLASRIRWVESRLLKRLKLSLRTPDGVKLTLNPTPLGSVGCYVPGGRARYPSTLLMAVVPAKVAGVRRIVACTPPLIDDATLAAAHIAGVDELYMVGGAQAIAAMAYGTESIKPVDKVVGPGGGYVAAAKLLVSSDVAIDFPAGPTELLVLAEGGADAQRIALELLSQAEHGPDSLVGVATDSEELAENVAEAFVREASRAERGEAAMRAWRENGFLAVCQSMEEAVELVNELAPEHLSIFSKKPGRLLKMVRNAGLISVNTPSALSDYAVGVSHVLPTWGWARVRGGLSVLDYVKLIYSVRAPRSAVKRMAPHVEALSKLEGLPAHWRAVIGR